MENKPYKALFLLNDYKSDDSRYLQALAAIKCNRLREAEKALSPMNNS